MDGLTPHAATHLLQAGPLTMALCEGQVRCLRFGDREIIRRIYVAVRDAGWTTIAGVVTNVSVEPAGDGFVARWDCLHDAGPIKFSWHGTVCGDASGAVSFTMEGTPLSDFDANRIGICVLHPIDELRGVRCWVETTSGETSRSEFPKHAHPHLAFSNVRSMRYAYEGGAEVSLAFEGDTFETEDQRQWGDASWKTYSRPSALPKPFGVRAGQVFSQSVTVAAGGAALVPWRPPAAVRVAVDASVGHAMPSIGFGWNGNRLSEAERQLLARTVPGHLRVEVVPARSGLVSGLQAAADEGQALGAPLALVVHVSRTPVAQIAALTEALDLVRPKIASVAVMSMVDALPVPDVVRAVKSELARRLPGVPVGLGVHSYFTELNRAREAVGDADFVAYPWSPTVHLDDDATIAENLSTPQYVAETFRAFAGGKPLELGSVTLRPSPKLAGVAAGASPPRHADARQASLLAAGFTIGHLAVAARAGFSRTTLFDATGPLGVIAGEGLATPVFHVLCDVAEFGDAVALKTRVSDPLHVAALVLQRGRSFRVLLANLKHEPIKVDLDLSSLHCQTGTMRRFGAGQWQRAVKYPDLFRASPTTAWSRGAIELGAQEVVRLDLA